MLSQCKIILLDRINSVSVLLIFSQLCALLEHQVWVLVNTGFTGAHLALLELSEDFCVMVLA